MLLDIFCRVIDNYGDAAVSYRLARSLKRVRPRWKIRYFCDNFDIFCTLFPQKTVQNGTKKRAFCTKEGVEFYASPAEAPQAAADAAIETLACGFPPDYELPKLLINWEYLTAEPWSAECHLMPSLIGGGRKKFFFMPGLLPHTGGLLSDNSPQLQAEAAKNRQDARKGFLEAQGLSKQYDINQPWASLYAYQIAADSLADAPQTLFLGPKQPYGGALPANCRLLKSLPLDSYSQLIYLCDFNLTRGEDSLSRALLSGLPFLWQAYPQEEEAHWLKIEALLRFLQGCAGPAAAVQMGWQSQLRAFNQNGSFNGAFMLENADALRRIAGQAQSRIAALGPQEENLACFLEQQQSVC